MEREGKGEMVGWCSSCSGACRIAGGEVQGRERWGERGTSYQRSSALFTVDVTIHTTNLADRRLSLPYALFGFLLAAGTPLVLLLFTGEREREREREDSARCSPMKIGR